MYFTVHKNAYMYMYMCIHWSLQAITVLNHAGICVSYQTAWKYLEQLTTEAHYQEVIQSGHWQWVFDNLNMHQPVRHEREGYFTMCISYMYIHVHTCIYMYVHVAPTTYKSIMYMYTHTYGTAYVHVHIIRFTMCPTATDRHSSMMNVTPRLAIRLRYLPDWEFDWQDMQPQRSRDTLTISDFLPSEDDASYLKTQATHYIMRILTEEFEQLLHLKRFVPEQRPLHPPKKSEVAPMKVLFKDEKYTSETIDILVKLMEDGNLNGQSQVRHHTHIQVVSIHTHRIGVVSVL